MEPKPEFKGQLVKVSGFVQNTPNDGEPATQQTDVWMAHTKSAVYFVFICHDDRPAAIRGHLARRENISGDDTVSVILDPFEDRRKGVLFSVNPVGVQADAAWTDSASLDYNIDADYSYDQVWDSDARVTAHGWMALIAIPFRSLRFRSTASDWGVVFQRTLPRNSEVDFWPRVATSVSGVLSQEATMHGIEGVTGSHNLQINPYALAQNERELIALDPLNPYFSSRGLEGTAGGEAKLIVKDSVVLDGTINPDFSDVESDQPQFTVNQRYSVYFPELRPFFLENANYFSTPILLVYTRNIVHPEYGIRLTGKIGATNLGFFAIDDRAPGETYNPGDPLYKQRAKYLVARVSEDLGKNSSVGLIYTDKEFGGGWNRVGGLDFTAYLSKSWTATGQVVETSTMSPNNPGTPQSYAAGPGGYFDLQRTGHSFIFDSVNKDYSTGFRSQVGFIPTTNLYSDQTHLTYLWYPKKKAIQSFGLDLWQLIAWDHQGNRLYRYTTFSPYITLPRQLIIAPQLGQNSDTLGPQDGYPLAHNVNFTENFGGIAAHGAPFTQLNFYLTALRAGNVNYNPPPGGVPSLLNADEVQLIFTFQPLRQLTADNTYLLDRDHAAANGAFVYESQTFRTKVNFQFTRSFSARIIAQYDSTLANPAETSLQRTKQIGTQALFTWLPHPGTVLYVGYNNDLQNLDRSLCNRGLTGACDPTNPVPPRSNEYLNDGKQFFVKFSYLFRF
ncbi:carbohydrate binding family 9 domain-containing protein [Telmatobacter sp. DSM 110680]|uniref:Carbohydrate binding family 9 domain-containing protein n=1 Tax=Telmatobacter sp. DSM 110680 TaxID=3036704 RepID=A0AAU7DK95_9BACT